MKKKKYLSMTLSLALVFCVISARADTTGKFKAKELSYGNRSAEYYTQDKDHAILYAISAMIDFTAATSYTTELSYSDSSDGIRYSNYNGSITLTFKDFGLSKEAYFRTSLKDDNELANIPCYAFIIAAYNLDKTISLEKLIDGYESAMDKYSSTGSGIAYYGGDKYKVDAFYSCESNEWSQLTLSWFDWSY